MKYATHPAASIFPLMTAEELAGLVEDIKENGQREPATFWNGQLIDGRNRAAACEQLGIDLDACELDPETDPVKWVVSHNLHRRHLTASQRSMVAVKIEELFKPAAKERQAEGQKSGGKEGGRGRPKNSSTQNLGESYPADKHAGEAAAEAAKALNVSRSSIDHAKTVLKEGSKDLIAAVERGDVSVSKAAKIAKTHDKKSQMAALNDKPSKKPSAERDVYVALRKLFDRMTAAERQQASRMWDEWLSDD